MRRFSSVALLLAVLGLLAGTLAPAPAGAKEGDPDDYCSHAPDRPLGWLFGDACRGHDECLDGLDTGAGREARLACDDSFLDDLLQAPHALTDRVCSESPVCELVARIYHFVVRFVTLRVLPDLGADAAAEGAQTSPAAPALASTRTSRM